jgi:hypothetical protein
MCENFEAAGKIPDGHPQAVGAIWLRDSEIHQKDQVLVTKEESPSGTLLTTENFTRRVGVDKVVEKAGFYCALMLYCIVKVIQLTRRTSRISPIVWYSVAPIQIWQ